MPTLLNGRLAAALCLLALAACTQDTPTLSDGNPAPAVPLVSVRCQANPRAGTVVCPQAPVSIGGNALIIGGQGLYVQVTAGTPSYSAGTFQFDVAVQNLIPQALGTTDGTTPDPAGVRLIFNSGPTVTGGTGLAVVANATGVGTFTAIGQPFFQYSGAALGGDGILSTNETSGNMTWQLTVPPTVTTFEFTLFVVAQVEHPNGYIDVTPTVDSLVDGASQALTATVRSAVGTAIPGQVVTWGTTDSAVATVDGAGTITAESPGSVTVIATSGARTGSAEIAVCPNLAVGGTYLMTSGNVCLAGGAAGAEYTVVPTRLATSNLAFSFTGNGIVPATGVPNPDLIGARGGLRVPGGPTPDDARHLRMLREQQQRSVGLQRVRMGGGGARRNITPGVPAVGAVMSLNVGQGFCSPTDMRASTVKSVGTHVIVMEDNSNPPGGPSAAQYDSIAAAYDLLVHPTMTGNFGTPFDIDGNSRVIALYTAAVNDLTPAGSGSLVGGFFYSRDLFSTASCAGSNQGEMFYMLAADPTGVHGNVRSVAYIMDNTIGVLGHEFQHLINASRRTYGPGGPFPLEQVWLNEGLSHIGEELIYYAASGYAPGQNLDLADLTASPAQTDHFFSFSEANFGRLRSWLLRPDTAGPFRTSDALPNRGASWAFLRYAADRRGGTQSTLWNGLVFSPDSGLTNLTNRLGEDPLPWMRDFAAAMYADDAGLGATGNLSQPSWNFRAIFAALDYDPGPGCTCIYPLVPHNPGNGVTDAFTLFAGGGAGYLRVGVPASGFAGIVTTAPSAGLGITVIRRE